MDSDITRIDIQEVIRQAVQAAMGRGVSPAQVRMIVEDMVPAPVLRMDRKPPGGDVYRARLGFDEGHMVWRTPEPSGGAPDFHFRGAEVEAGSLQVTVGSWTRNGVKVTLAPDTDKTFKTIAHGSGDYIYLKLGTTSYATFPPTNPMTLTLEAASSIPTDGATYSGEFGINNVLVLGKFTEGVWDQFWTGGDFDDFVTVPDSARWNKDATKSFTLDFRRDDSYTENELALYGVLAAANQQVPYIAKLESSPYGMLYWDYMVKCNSDARLTATGEGPSGSTPNCKLVSAYPTAPSLSLSGNTLRLSWNERDFRVGDGRLDLLAEEESSGATVDLELTPPTHEHNPGDVVGDWPAGDRPDWFAHQYLSDMPSATNTDHDERYWGNFTQAGESTETFKTTGDVEAGNAKAEQFWSGAAKDRAGRTVIVAGYDPDTGDPVRLEFVGGILVEEVVV